MIEKKNWNKYYWIMCITNKMFKRRMNGQDKNEKLKNLRIEWIWRSIIILLSRNIFLIE